MLTAEIIDDLNDVLQNLFHIIRVGLLLHFSFRCLCGPNSRYGYGFDRQRRDDTQPLFGLAVTVIEAPLRATAELLAALGEPADPA
jgi:hypothetical protein